MDTLQTKADPDGAGPLTSGYDPIFREPVKLPAAGAQGPGTKHRVEKAAVFLRCQVELPKFGIEQAAAGGNLPQNQLVIVFHFADLEALGLVDAVNGQALIRLGDRLAALYKLSGALIQTMPVPMYATVVQPASFGLAAGDRNLLLVTFEQRDKGVS